MSTKMSTDLNITRPTSRVLRAPGGGSTFSIAGGSTEESQASKGTRHIPGVTNFSIAEGSVEAPPPLTPAKKHVATSIQPSISLGSVDESNVISGIASLTTNTDDKEVVTIDEIMIESSEIFSTGKVGILIGGNLAVETLTNAITKSLVKEGITGSLITIVNDVFLIPFAAQKLVKTCDVIIAAAIVSDPTHSISSSLHMSLSQIAVSTGIPIIPGIIVRDSLLEAKALLSTLSSNWAKSASSVLSINTESITIAPAPEHIVIQPIAYDSTINDATILLDILRESLKEHGARGIAGIARKFRIVDDNGNGKIDLNEFTKLIHEHALKWTSEQIKIIFDKFDEDKSGSIDYEEFLITLRGQLNDRRYQLVLLAFEILDNDHSGLIELNDIKAKYNADKHPDVLSGKRSTSEVLREFLDTFDIDKDGKVTTTEFCKYYSHISASIDDDDYFELMIRNAWHISGGDGWSENTTCRRVLVGYLDGHTSVVEIKNDIGLDNNDKEKMIELLIKQGVIDIAYIETGDGIKFNNPNVTIQQSSTVVPTVATTPAPVPAVPVNRGRYGAGGGRSNFTIG